MKLSFVYDAHSLEVFLLNDSIDNNCFGSSSSISMGWGGGSKMLNKLVQS